MAEVFGTADQQRMLIRGAHLEALLQNDPRFCSHGRGLQLADYTAETAEQIVAVARLIGAGGCEMVPKAQTASLIEALQASGLKVDSYRNFMGDDQVIATARVLLSERPLPPDVRVKTIDRNAPAAWLQAFADVALPNGVLPSIGSAMRGVSRPGFAMLAVDRAERPVATASAFLARHASHPLADMVQWGQLATSSDRQRQGIALAMGALSILHAAEQLGARRFSTGIRLGNEPSERLCRALGLEESDFDIVLGIDPAAFSDDRLTK